MSLRPDEHEAGALEIGLDHFGIDPVELLDRRPGVAVGVGDMVDDADHRARLHRRIDRLEESVRVHPRDAVLVTFPIDVVIIEVEHHEVG